MDIAADCILPAGCKCNGIFTDVFLYIYMFYVRASCDWCVRRGGAFSAGVFDDLVLVL